MRLALFPALAVALLAGPAAAQERQSPRQMIDEMGMGPSRAEVRRLVEAARDQPLGSERNPVRVNGPQGERTYIARLRCADGTPPQVGQRANTGVGAFGTIVDVYPLDCGSAAPGQIRLVMDMYHDDHAEIRAPEGFTLVADDAAPVRDKT